MDAFVPIHIEPLGGNPYESQNALLTVRQMGDADRLTVEAGTSVVKLMENAGQAVAKAITGRWTKRPTVVLCGPGNNGGDGFVVARALSDLGWHVRVALLGTRETLTGAARHHADLWSGIIAAMTPTVLDGMELVVDGIFGAGLSRALAGPSADTLAMAAERKIPIVAIDVPSGVMGDSGEALGAVACELTVTFFRKKPGHLLLPSKLLCGEVIVADIGIDDSVLKSISPHLFENEPSLWLSELPRPREGGNKYSRGHAMLFGGYPMTGAARMAAHATARVGAGLTTIAVSPIALPIYAAGLASVMVQPVATCDDFHRIIKDERITSFLIGPGAGVGAETRSRVLDLLRLGRPVVLDADAITSFADNPTTLHQAITGPCVLTPHDGEFRRLFDASGDKLTRALRAANQSGAIVILKGSDTVIAAPDGRCVINTNAPATLATAGSGDVLSGIVLGLLAQGMDPFLAAAAAVWLHAAAAREFGPCLMADDLPDMLPAVYRRLFP